MQLYENSEIHNQYKILQKKMTMLKQGLLSQRQKRNHTIQQINTRKNACTKQEEQIFRKKQLNQILHNEIKDIMTQIVDIRARKKKLIDKYMNLQSDNDSGIEGIKSIQTSQN